MAKHTKSDIEQAKARLTDAIGITADQAATWIAAHEAEQAARNAAQDHYRRQREAMRAKAEELGRDLEQDEVIAICKAIPEPMTKAARKRISDAFEAAEAAIKRSRQITVIARHVSSSGMSRRLSLHIFRDDQSLQLSYNAHIVTGYRYHDRDGAVVIGGCGMDMGFALVYELSHRLYGNGYVLTHRWL